MSERDTVPDVYMNEYEEGHAAGLEETFINPYDSETQYDSWHHFNSGLIDGYKNFLKGQNNG